MAKAGGKIVTYSKDYIRAKDFRATKFLEISLIT